MRISLSLDKNLLCEVDAAARSMGLSRSQLFAGAVAEFLGRRRAAMLRRLNEVYGAQPDAGDRELLQGLKAKLRHAVRT
jgi:metal-responsive CopG/Arc/MetJ family transcriptional regulator